MYTIVYYKVISVGLVKLYMREWGNSLALVFHKEIWARYNLYYGKGVICKIGDHRFLGVVSFKGRGKAIRIPTNLVERAGWTSFIGREVEVDINHINWSPTLKYHMSASEWAVFLNPHLFPEREEDMDAMRAFHELMRVVDFLD